MLTIVLAVPSESIAPLTVKFMVEPAPEPLLIFEVTAFDVTAVFATLATTALEIVGIVIVGIGVVFTVGLGMLDPSTPEMLLNDPPDCAPPAETGFKSGKPRLTAL